MMGFFKCTRRKAAVRPITQFFLCRRDDVVVETFDLYLAGAVVVDVANKLHQLSDRISCSASGFARVGVNSSGFQRQYETHQSTQSCGAGGPFARNPNGV